MWGTSAQALGELTVLILHHHPHRGPVLWPALYHKGDNLGLHYQGILTSALRLAPARESLTNAGQGREKGPGIPSPHYSAPSITERESWLGMAPAVVPQRGPHSRCGCLRWPHLPGSLLGILMGTDPHLLPYIYLNSRFTYKTLDHISTKIKFK